MKNDILDNRTCADFCREMTLLTKSGMGNTEALELLSKSAASLAFLAETVDELDFGTPLGEALAKSGHFPDHMCSLITVGEQTGRMTETLTSLAEYYENRDRMSHYMKEALTYPAVLLVIMLAVIVALLTTVLPIFDTVYARLGGSMTGIAGGLLAFGKVLNALLPVIGIIILVIAVLAALAFLIPSFRDKFSSFRGSRGHKGISGKMNRASLAHAISMGVSSGMGMDEAVDMAGSLMNNIPVLKESCTKAAERLRNGESTANVLMEENILPEAEARMLEIGIRSGSSDEAMEHIADRMAESAESALAARISKIEPAMVVVSCLLIGLILLAVMMPLLNIMGAIG